METLEKLFGGTARVKIIRLFLFNPYTGFENKDIVLRSKVSSSQVRKEVALLSKIGLIKKKSFFKEFSKKMGKKDKQVKRKKVIGWFVDEAFPLMGSLKDLVTEVGPLNKESMIKKFGHGGRMKLVLLAGVFINKNDSSRVDILIVGDKLKRRVIENGIKVLESEIGKELNYAILETKEFIYRISIYDKFIRDILDYPNEKILNKIGAI